MKEGKALPLLYCIANETNTAPEFVSELIDLFEAKMKHMPAVRGVWNFKLCFVWCHGPTCAHAQYSSSAVCIVERV